MKKLKDKVRNLENKIAAEAQRISEYFENVVSQWRRVKNQAGQRVAVLIGSQGSGKSTAL